MAILQNQLPKWIAFTIWHLVQLGLFVGYYVYYANSDRFVYTRVILGKALPVARGSAGCLKLNCALLLLPVCRNLLYFVRTYLCKSCLRSLRRLLDLNIEFHKWCAYEICFWSILHAVAHCYNLQYYVLSESGALDNTSAVVTPRTLSGLSNDCPRSGEDWLNPVCHPNTSPIIEAWRFFPVWSGLVISLALIIIVVSATEFIRRSYFEIFWYTHHVFIVFFGFLIFHSFQGIVRGQKESNFEVNDPKTCADQVWCEAKCKCGKPKFEGNAPELWAWLIIPCLIYFVECVLRCYYSFQSVLINEVHKHPSRVLELRMIREKRFKMEAGQYIYLKVPQISYLEWHPFTLTSAPEDDYFSVHIRMVGDWTNKLGDLIKEQPDGTLDRANLPKVSVDGPYGTASEEWTQYDVDILIGAGIGVTPFASILKHLSYSHHHVHNNVGNQGNQSGDRQVEEFQPHSRLTKVYFFWICSDMQSFEWFSSMLEELEAAETGSSFLEYHIYLTRGWDKNQARNIALAEGEDRDVVTGLRHKTNFGRPEWDSIFQTLAESHEGKRMGVFFCGPEQLSSVLLKTCNNYSKDRVGDTHFVYHKENF